MLTIAALPHSFKARQPGPYPAPPAPTRAFHRALMRIHANDALYAHAEEGRFENLVRAPSPDIEAEAGGNDNAHAHAHPAMPEITAADFYPGAVSTPKTKHPRGFTRALWPHSYAQSSLEFGFRSTKARTADKRLLAGSYIAVGVLTLICFVVIAHHVDM